MPEEGGPVEVASSVGSAGPALPASAEPEGPAAPPSGNRPQPSTASVYSPTASGRKLKNKSNHSNGQFNCRNDS